MFLLIIGKAHLRLFPCRDGIYSILWPGDIIIPMKKHVIVCFFILTTAFFLAFITDLAMEAGNLLTIDSYRIYLEGVSYCIDPIVRYI
jgi:hypothetical protein